MYRQLLASFIVVLSLIINNNVFGQFTTTHKAWNKIHGKVRSYSTSTYSFFHPRDTVVNKRLVFFDSLVLNRNGQVIESVHDSDYEGKNRITYAYDKSGNLTEMTQYDFKGNMMFRDIFTTSAKKDLITMTRHYLNLGFDSSRVIYRYKVNAQGRILEKYEYNETFEPHVKLQYSRTVYKYDAKGYRIEDLLYGLNDIGKFKRSMEYDKSGNVLTCTDSLRIPVEDVKIFTYPKYDKYQNWLEQQRHVKGKLYGVAERSIVYYK